MKVATTDLASSIVTMQEPVPEHSSPDQPAKIEPVEAVAVNTTSVFSGKSKEQIKPQSIPAGSLATVPLPLPSKLTVSKKLSANAGDVIMNKRVMVTITTMVVRKILIRQP